jgi:hypothetical protein
MTISLFDYSTRSSRIFAKGKCKVKKKYEKASEFRFEKHKNKLRMHELKYKCLVYLEECEFTCYRWKQLQEVRLFMQREFGY